MPMTCIDVKRISAYDTNDVCGRLKIVKKSLMWKNQVWCSNPSAGVLFCNIRHSFFIILILQYKLGTYTKYVDIWYIMVTISIVYFCLAKSCVTSKFQYGQLGRSRHCLTLSYGLPLIQFWLETIEIVCKTRKLV